MRQAHDRSRQRAAKLVRPIGGPPRLSEEWRRWIAENLLIGAVPEDLIARLGENGCPPLVAKAEIERAAASPYLQGAMLLKRRLDKRDWLLAAYAELAAGDPGSREIPRKAGLAPEDFYRDHYAAHRPVILTGLIDRWPAMQLWSLDHFEAVAGDAAIEVQTGRDANPSYEMESDKHKAVRPLREVLGWLRADRQTNDFYVTANNGGLNRDALAALWEEVGDLPGYLAPEQSVGRSFFWMGPRGTITPFHHDLTNNLLVQIGGRKRVTLVPSWETPRMLNHLHCYSALPGPAALAALPPAQRPASMECVLAPGEILFLPVGWWHHVEGLDVTIGLSFTNFTRPNDFFSGYESYGAM